MPGKVFQFVGGPHGTWRVAAATTPLGAPLEPVARLEVLGSVTASEPRGAVWRLRGVTSHERYLHRAERVELTAVQPMLARPESTQAAMIAIRKTEAWWALAQDERRRIFEERSHHIRTGLAYLPAIARRLHHCRDLGSEEPFDFLTWFEFAPRDAAAFDALVAALRGSEEWSYVEREVDLRLDRNSAGREERRDAKE